MNDMIEPDPAMVLAILLKSERTISGKALRPNAEDAIRAKDIRGTIEANLPLFN